MQPNAHPLGGSMVRFSRRNQLLEEPCWSGSLPDFYHKGICYSRELCRGLESTYLLNLLIDQSPQCNVHPGLIKVQMLKLKELKGVSTCSSEALWLSGADNKLMKLSLIFKEET